MKDPKATEEQVKTQLQNCIGNSHADRRSSGQKDRRRKVNLTTKFGKGKSSDKSSDKSTDAIDAEENTDTGNLPPEPITPTDVGAPSFSTCSNNATSVPRPGCSDDYITGN